jgi:hypothetical protein
MDESRTVVRTLVVSNGSREHEPSASPAPSPAASAPTEAHDPLPSITDGEDAPENPAGTVFLERAEGQERHDRSAPP